MANYRPCRTLEEAAHLMGKTMYKKNSDEKEIITKISDSGHYQLRYKRPLLINGLPSEQVFADYELEDYTPVGVLALEVGNG